MEGDEQDQPRPPVNIITNPASDHAGQVPVLPPALQPLHAPYVVPPIVPTEDVEVPVRLPPPPPRPATPPPPPEPAPPPSQVPYQVVPTSVQSSIPMQIVQTEPSQFGRGQVVSQEYIKQQVHEQRLQQLQQQHYGAGDNPGYVVQTEVTYTPSPRGIGRKKVKLNPVTTTVSGNGHRNGSFPNGNNNGKPPPAPPIVKQREDFGANVGVIGSDKTGTDGVGVCGLLLTWISWMLVLVTLPFSLFVCFKVVQEYERAVIFRLGRLLQGGSKGPGIFFVLPCIESYQKVDLRTITLGVPPQEVLTRDSVTVSVDAVVYYRVSNATVSVANVENAHHSTRLLAQTTLRNILGTKSLHEILSDRESISSSMQAALDEATEPWGIKVERVEIKDVRLPVQLQRAMAAEAEAAREARAKVIAAEGEQKASRALREASDVISGSSSALQLRYLQTLNTISAEKNSTIVFPLPIDILSHLLKSKED